MSCESVRLQTSPTTFTKLKDRAYYDKAPNQVLHDAVEMKLAK